MDFRQIFDRRSTCVPPQNIMLMSLEITSMHIHMITLEMHRRTTKLIEGIFLLSQENESLTAHASVGCEKELTLLAGTLSGILLVYS